MTGIQLTQKRPDWWEVEQDIVNDVLEVYSKTKDMFANVQTMSPGRWAVLFPGEDNLYYMRVACSSLQVFYGDILLGEADFDGCF